MDRNDFLVRDYEIKASYLSSHIQRMMTRFNFFVTLESALLGGPFLLNAGQASAQLALFGAVLSVIWWCVGLEDMRLLGKYKWRVNQVADNIPLELKGDHFQPVGDSHKGLKDGSSFPKWLWESEHMKLGLFVILPLIALCLWIILLGTQL
jgi:hypothetical protein